MLAVESEAHQVEHQVDRSARSGAVVKGFGVTVAWTPCVPSDRLERTEPCMGFSMRMRDVGGRIVSIPLSREVRRGRRAFREPADGSGVQTLTELRSFVAAMVWRANAWKTMVLAAGGCVLGWTVVAVATDGGNLWVGAGIALGLLIAGVLFLWRWPYLGQDVARASMLEAVQHAGLCPACGVGLDARARCSGCSAQWGREASGV